jgi:hypothetical protein
MKTNSWRESAELIGILAIVASLIFLGLQIRQTQAIATSDMNASALLTTLEESNAIIENAEVWAKGNAGEDLSAVEEVIFERLVLNFNDRYYFPVQQQLELGLEDTAALDVATYAGFLFENPGALRVWRAHESSNRKYRSLANPNERVTTDWVEAVEEMLNRIREAEGIDVQ